MPSERRPKGDPRTKVYNSRRWQRTREFVFDRDGYACVICHRPLEKRECICDHRDPLLEIIAKGRDPFDPDECQTLCHGCSGAKDGPRGSGGPSKRERPNRFLATVLAKQQVKPHGRTGG